MNTLNVLALLDSIFNGSLLFVQRLAQLFCFKLRANFALHAGYRALDFTNPKACRTRRPREALGAKYQ